MRAICTEKFPAQDAPGILTNSIVKDLSQKYTNLFECFL